MTRAFLCGFIIFSLVFAGRPLPAGDGPTGRLCVVNKRLNRTYEICFRNLESISIRFFHSYDRQWVEETFILQNKVFVPYEVLYADDTYDFRDQRYEGDVVIGDETIKITNIRNLKDNSLSAILTRIAHTKPQRLIIRTKEGTRTCLFTDWGNPGDQIHLSIR